MRVLYSNSEIAIEKQTRFTETRVVAKEQQEGDLTTKEVCRLYSVSKATFYNWKSKVGMWRHLKSSGL
ncbi:transposase [Cnuella takakiae]|uniref:transposase n=1 Tax=Cnuella takakiae TaxID=1302690 RepID=UPI0011604506